jgi:hypothetical protein
MLQARRPIKSVPTNGCHLDLLGRTLKEGQYVAVSDGGMHVAQIQRFTPKMVEIIVIDRKYRFKCLKYANEMVILEGPDIFMWVLSNGS